MQSPNLRVFYGPNDELLDQEPARDAARETKSETVRVPLTEIIPLLTDAVRSRRTWLRDFEEDEITISMDLYEVILAYQYYRYPSA